MAGQVKRWTFTWNNPGDARPTWDVHSMAYLCFEKETAPDTGTPHWQGYVRFTTRKRLATVKKIWGDAVHWEPAKGNEQQNKDYCSKDPDGGFEEHGEFKGEEGVQGKRSDLAEVADLIINKHASYKEILQTHPSDAIRYHSGITKAIAATRPEPPKIRDVHNIILWGDSAVGKSHRVHMKYSTQDLFLVTPGRGPWDKYAGQPVIFFDEFDSEKWDLAMILKVCDKWSLELDARYSNNSANWTTVIFACNNDPKTSWFPKLYRDDKALTALWRRMTPPMGDIYHVVAKEQEIPGFFDEDATEPQDFMAPAAQPFDPITFDDMDL